MLVLLMLTVDVLGGFSYAMRSAIKMVLFGVIPYFYMKNKGMALPNFRKDKNFSKVLIFALSLIVIFFVGGTLFLKLGLFSQVKENLRSTVGVKESNYLFVYLYIILVNCPLEEFFFRHFALKVVDNQKQSILFSSILFAIYHVGMLQNMFVWYLFVLSIIALFVVGVIFSKINTAENSILNSVVLHMTANFCINTIGLVIMYNLV